MTQQPRKGTIRAYVLIHTRAGRSKAIVQELVQLPGVISAHALWGVPDVILYAEVGSQPELDDLVMEKIQTIDGIERTDTHIAL